LSCGILVSQCGLVKWDRKLIVVWGVGRDCVVQVSVCLFGGDFGYIAVRRTVAGFNYLLDGVRSECLLCCRTHPRERT
jgi:hypothetical protein